MIRMTSTILHNK